MTAPLAVKPVRVKSMAIIRVGDINMEYYVEGDGPPLLLIHGFSMTAHDWGEPFLKELRPHFRVIRFSNRGTGLTDKPKVEYSHQMMADDAAGLLNELGIRGSHVLGVSMGGAIAQHMALSHAEVVRGLVLGCTGPGGPHAVLTDPEVIALLTPVFLTTGPARKDLERQAWPAVYTQAFIDRERDYLEEMLEPRLEHFPPLDTINRQFAARSDTYDRLPEIKAPTLIIHGDQDRMVPVQNAHLLHERIPNSTLHIVPDAGHGFTTEKPRESADAIVKFLSSIPIAA